VNRAIILQIFIKINRPRATIVLVDRLLKNSILVLHNGFDPISSG
jgi:hypothetical protein